MIFVNDGSTDDSFQLLNAAASCDDRIKLVNFSRNFGHEAAMAAGLDFSTGDAVICMDADLQHPLSCLSPMLREYMDGYEIVMMLRSENKQNGILKRLCNNFFYYVLNKLSPHGFIVNASDFFLVSRRVVTVIKSSFRERTRFLRGYIQVVGFRSTLLEYVAEIRLEGVSKYTFKTLLELAINALFIFSNLPLRLGLMLSFIVGGFSILVGIYSIVMKFVVNTPTGYTTIVSLISLLFSVQFLLMGIIGEYIGYIFLDTTVR